MSAPAPTPNPAAASAAATSSASLPLSTPASVSAAETASDSGGRTISDSLTLTDPPLAMGRAATHAAAAGGFKRPLDGAADERRVQPRHSCNGSDSASSSDSAAAPSQTDRNVDAAALSPPPPVDRLYRHALESVFAFLDLRGLAAALRVSHGWQAAVGSMRRMELAVDGPPILRMAESTMGRHVSAISAVWLTAETLSLLAGRMTHLGDLNCDLRLPQVAAPLAFPAALRVLHVVLCDLPDAADINAAMTAIAQLVLLEELNITVHMMDPRLSFGPLISLPLLRRLDVCWLSPTDALSDAQVDQLRALLQLQELNVPALTPLLRRLLRQPHDLQWQELSLPHPLDDEAAALLPQLPSLTDIDCLAACSRFDWLCGLPNLRHVHLAFNSTAKAAGFADSLVAGLQHCANIEILRLDTYGCVDLTATQLAELLPRLPLLRDLSLQGLSIDSLSFLSLPPLTNQLSRLDLYGCRRLPLSELRHVHALGGLKTLELFSSFVAPLDDHAQSLLEPPSALMPQLEQFFC